MSDVRERELLVTEQLVLSLLLSKAGRMGDGEPDAAIDWPDLRAIDYRNEVRIAELEGPKINRMAFAVRAAIMNAPDFIHVPVRHVVRILLNFILRQSCPFPTSRSRRWRPILVPFGRHFPEPSLSAPVGVVMHIFYPEFAPEMRLYLENIPGRVDLYISTDTASKQAVLEQAFADWTAGRVEVRLAPNRGRDIAPKLITFRDVYDRHPFVLHLHSKKSPHEAPLRLWRFFLLENLVGEREIAAGILSVFEREPRLGMVASDHYFPVSNGIAWGDNFGVGQMIASRMGAPIDPSAPLDFPSGSMFWARSAALKPLLDLGLTVEDFPQEAGQSDGTLAHAIERLYFHSCELAGLRWMKVCRSELNHPANPQPSTIENAGDLALSLRDRLK